MRNLIRCATLLGVFFYGQSAISQDNCAARANFDWDDHTGTPTGSTYGDQTVDFTFSVSGSGGITFNDTYSGNLIPTDDAETNTLWGIQQDDNETNTYTIDFNGDLLYDFCFDLLDVDTGEGSVDFVTVNAYDASNTLITLTVGDLSNQGADVQYNGANVFEGTDTSPFTFAGFAFPSANVTICFPSPIQRIEIVYDSNDGATNQYFGISDFDYCSQDFDDDGTKDINETDSDGDGIADATEGNSAGDADGDGIPNFADTDFTTFVDLNGDNVNDNLDTDLDQAPDALDLDSDNDGIPDFTENLPLDGGNPADTDSDGTDDYIDSDSDEDGVSDLIEGNDIDFNGIADIALAGTDADGDGIDDNLDNVNGRGAAGNVTGSVAAVAANLVDDDTDPDYRDTDDDGDGTLTSAEIPDANGDGIPDYISACEDGSILDFEDYAVGSTPGPVFTVDASNITFSFVDASGESVSYEIDDQLHDPEHGIFVSQDIASNTYFTLLKVKFDRPLEGFCFDLLDIDLGDHLDSMSVNIFRDGDVIVLDSDNIINGASNQLNSNNFIVGTGVSGDDEYLGNVRLCLRQTVDSLVINYGNFTTPSFQYIGLNDFTWCGIDHDYDEILDINDPDDNNNGISDIVEGGGIDHSLDTDGDKIPDFMDADFAGFTDTNADGINDNADLDLDGVPDHIDKDTDNDGIPDAVEANGGLLPANMDEDGAYPPAYSLNNDSDNDGIVDDVDTSTGGTALTNPNTDGDAVSDFRDLDSDGDGIPDLVEAGGTDSNGDGMVDSFADATGDGFNDTYDPDVFGTTLLSGSINKFALDTDGDGLANYLDIDSDDDGITDDVEAQTIAGFIAPTGTDTDGDGWDDSYDSDNGGTAIILLDSDSDTSEDFIDTDSDDDGVLDRVESRDADSDGVADELPSGSDSDNDGLDDSFDTDNGGSSPATPDTDADGGVDFRDIDDDGDGVATINEDYNTNGNYADDFTQGGSPTPDYLFFTNDPDGDGLDNAIDFDDNNDGILDADVATCSIVNGNGMTATETGGVTNATNAQGVADDAYATVGNGDVLTVQLDDVVPNGLTITLRMARNEGGGANSTLRVEQSNDDVSYVNAIDYNFSSNVLADYDYTLTADAEYIRFTRIARGNRVDAVTYSFQDCIDTDSDGDGIADRLDRDSDGDGIPNAYEANDGILPANMDETGQYPAAYAAANDTDGDGIVNDLDADDGGTPLANNDFDGDGLIDALDADSDADGIPDAIESIGTDTNANGIPDSYTDTDADGNLDYRDGDSDNDGILDLREGQTTSGYVGAPSGTDTDNDGIDDSFDADNGGTAITGNDHDTDGTLDFQDSDSDNDGISDLIEGNDNNADGATDAALAGNDNDGDGIDDTFDPDDGGSAVVLQNTDGDAEPDWRDNDDDGDGTPTADENVDINPANGTPDYLESNGNTCGPGKTNNGTGTGQSVAENNGGTRTTSALGTPDYIGSGDDNSLLAFVNGAGEFFTLDLAETVAEGLDLAIVFSAFEANSDIEVSVSVNNIDFSGAITYADLTQRPNGETQNYTVPAGGARFVRFTWVSGTPYVDGLTFTSCADDSDNDGVQDDSDNDSDNDGLTDLQEGNGTDPSADADVDGVANYLDSDFAGYEDINTDGINDNFDQDLDGIPNHQDLDSDNDGIPDAVEANGGSLPANMTSEGTYLSSYVSANDTDADGHANDVDTDNGGTALTNPDSDNGTGYDDGLPDFLDRDSDNDGITDTAENNGTDNNRDGALDSFVDTDGDGLNDSVDPDNGGTALSIINTDGDGNPDYLDTDSDGDSAGSPGLGDLFEGHDSNFDGTPSWDDDGDLVLDTNEGNIDLDGDGIIDAFDPNQGGIGAALPNADGDGLPNFRDDDDDDDGTLTIAEDTDANGNYFDDFTQGQSGEFASVPDYLYNDASPLPVELISFKVVLKNQKAELTWVTAQEINNDYFSIEYSNDGLSFSSIGNVEGNGTISSVSNYSFTHNNPKSGFNYYRLKQVDYDGQSEYSEIKRISLGAFEDVSISVYPNPADEYATLIVNEGIATSIELLTLSGTILQSIRFEEGVSSHEFDISGLKGGMYLIRVKGPDVNTIKRLMVR
ncbi:T9SS type A sorting domain-containing protein [Ekhidna sp. To15]|uniref:T9SS type A sorting domain-containing protein n=1 Tax=Ekhidna sp. To15 TaxID=3395267 RepID=UPI003F5255F3